MATCKPGESPPARPSLAAHRAVPRPLAIGLVATLTNAVLVGLVLLVAEPAFSTNDCVGMMRIASGTMTGEPSEYLVYTNVLIGRVLTHLYRANPTVDWYSFYVFGAHFAAITGLLFTLLWHRFSLLTAGAYLLVFFGLDCCLWIEIQFTAVAILAGTCGALMLLCAEDCDGRRSYAAPIAGILLIALSAMIRKEGFFLSLLVAAPCVFHEAWRRKSWRIAVCLAAGAALGYGAIRYDQHVYMRDPQWREYTEYNRARARLQRFNFLNYSADPQFFGRLGWSSNDVSMFDLWFNADAETYSKEKLSRILDHYGWGGLNRDDWYPFLVAQLRLIAPFVRYSAFMFFLASFLAAGNRLRFLRAAVVLLAPVAGAMVYLSIVGRLPERISLPVLYFVNAGFVSAALALRDKRAAEKERVSSGLFGHVINLKCLVLLEAKPHPTWAAAGDGNRVGFARLGGRVYVRELLLVALAAAFLGSAYGVARNLWSVNAQNRRSHAQWDALVESLEAWQSRFGGEELIVARAGAFPFQWDPPFAGASGVAHVTLIPLGWTTHSPHYQALLRTHQIDDLHRALFERDDVYLMCFDFEASIVADFIREHYGIDVQAKTVHIAGQSLLVKFERASKR